MNRQNRRLWIALFCALLVIVYWLGPVYPPAPRPALEEGDFDELFGEEIHEEQYYRMVDEDGRSIVVTGRRLRPGDRYLAADNRLFEVSSVEGYLARARYVEEVKIELPWDASAEDEPFVLPVQGRPAYRIAIYHSHNAESYLPSDGTDSIYGRGGIHDVGVAFKESLKRKGIEVLYSERFHLPHDRGAYRRSRVTAQQLLSRRPDAIFDVHRDAAPWDAYSMEIDGELITQLQFVVGLSNPGAAANRKYAFDLKGYADRVHPGLVRGIFLIWGGYNQDLSPMSLLLEVGAHTNAKEAAIGGITLFADVVGYYFYGPETLENGAAARDSAEEGARPPAFYRDAGGISGAISGTVLGLLLTSLGAALGFYFLNNPGALEKLFIWWERFPERSTAAAVQVKYFSRNFPALARKKWADFPENLKQERRLLRQEVRDFPRWLQGRLEKLRLRGGKIAQAVRVWFKELPYHWRRSWALFLLESRELPGFLQRTLERARETMVRAAAWFKRTLPAAWQRLIVSVRLAWARTAEEAAHWAALIREKIMRLRSRLRS